MRPGSDFEYDCGIELTVKFTIWQCQVAKYLWWLAPNTDVPIRYLDGAKYFLPYGFVCL